jgi:hypothetical protein
MTVVIPAEAGIQYAASRFSTQLLWNTGSSAFADDDSRIQFSNSFVRRHTFAISPRIAPKFCRLIRFEN